MIFLRIQYWFFFFALIMIHKKKESCKIININVWHLFSIHLTFSYQNSQLSNVFSWIYFKISCIYFFNLIYRSIIQTIFYQGSFSVCNMMFFIILFSLKLPVQLVLITTDVVSSNPGRGEEYLIQHCYVITFVSDLHQVGCVLRFPQTNQTDATI
jgi:hypothetical protein